MSALQPLQILLGRWNGTRRNKPGVDQAEWAWDFQTDPAHPALAMQTTKSNWLKSARLTFDVAAQEYELNGEDTQGAHRRWRGTLIEPVNEVLGDDDRLQRTYKLQLTEVGDTSDAWQFVFNQQNNDRYLWEISAKKGGRFLRVETINTLREGASFAAKDNDYGERTCIISQGLGVIQVQHAGRSYWVCCTGCKAAFEENPQKWLDRWEARQKELKSAK